MDNPEKFPTIWGALLLLSILFFLQVLITLVVYEFVYQFDNGDAMATGIVSVLSYSLFIPTLMGFKKLSYGALFNPGPNSVRSTILVLFVPIALIAYGSVYWISDLTTLVLQFFPADQEEYEMLNKVAGSGIISVIIISFIAPVCEEIVFRGIILRSFLKNYSVGNAMLLSSALFAAYHMTVTQIPVAMLLGYFSAWLYVKTRSLWPSILAHFLYNSFAMYVWSSDIYEYADYEDTLVYNSPGTIIGSVATTLLGLILLWYLFNRASKKH